MSKRDSDQAELDRIRSNLIGLDVELKLQQLRLKAGFDPDQPRVPSGNPEGGRWSGSGEGSGGGGDGSGGSRGGWRSGGGKEPRTASAPIRRTVRSASGRPITFETHGRVQTIFDDKGRAISKSRLTPTGLERIPTVQQVAGVPANIVGDAFDAARQLYNELSEKDLLDGVIGTFFIAKLFMPPKRPRLPSMWGRSRAKRLARIALSMIPSRSSSTKRRTKRRLPVLT